jgi:hypothetical protein
LVAACARVGPFARLRAKARPSSARRSAGDYAVDDAPGRERLRREDGGGEHHLRGACYTDARGETLGPARVRNAAGHRLDLSDLTARRSPDQIARKADLERAGVALAVDECEGWDRQTLDGADEWEDGRFQLQGLGLVDRGEDRNVGPRGEVIALGSHEHRAHVAAGSVVDSGAQIGEEFAAEEVLRRAVDHDLAEVIELLERDERHRQPQCPE